MSILLLVLTLSTVTPTDDPELLGLSIRSKVQVGGQNPALVLTPAISVKKLSIKLTTEGRSVNLRSGPIARGKKKELTWKQPVGTAKWNAVINVVYGNGDKSDTTIDFETTVFPKIAHTISKKDVDLENQSLTVKLNQPAARVDLTVWGDNGEIIYNDGEDFNEVEANTPLVVSWEQPEGVAVLKLSLKVHSVFGFWSGAEITPWEADIPHEDVEFDFGKADVRPDQAPRIDKTLELLADKIKRYGGLLKLNLYVGGFTDSVGSPGSNIELSQRRARSIGTYFRRKGVKIPIYFKGYGEAHQAVKTPDETKEPKNRRAVYILSTSPPRALSAGGWMRL